MTEAASHDVYQFLATRANGEEVPEQYAKDVAILVGMSDSGIEGKEAFRLLSSPKEGAWDIDRFAIAALAAKEFTGQPTIPAEKSIESQEPVAVVEQPIEESELAAPEQAELKEATIPQFTREEVVKLVRSKLPKRKIVAQGLVDGLHTDDTQGLKGQIRWSLGLKRATNSPGELLVPTHKGGAGLSEGEAAIFGLALGYRLAFKDGRCIRQDAQDGGAMTLDMYLKRYQDNPEHAKELEQRYLSAWVKIMTFMSNPPRWQ